MKKILLITSLAILLVIAIAGCTGGTPTYSGKPTGGAITPEVPQPTTVQTLNMIFPMSKNWDADPEKDGIEVTINPKDRDDKLVKTAGTISAKLWLREYDENFNPVRGDLIQEWDNIPITKDNYDFMGAKIRLEYKDFEPESMQFGWLELTLTTPDGKQFIDRAETVMLG